MVCANGGGGGGGLRKLASKHTHFFETHDESMVFANGGGAVLSRASLLQSTCVFSKAMRALCMQMGGGCAPPPPAGCRASLLQRTRFFLKPMMRALCLQIGGGCL